MLPETVILETLPLNEPHKIPIFSLDPVTCILAFSIFKFVTTPSNELKNPTLESEFSIFRFLIAKPLPINVPLNPSIGNQSTPDKSISFFKI